MLTQRQERFCLNIISGMSQHDSWLNAGYSPNCSAAVVDVKASQLAAQAKVRVRISELQKQVEAATIATIVERKQRLTESIQARMTDFVDENGQIEIRGKRNTGAISEYEVKRTKYGYQKRIKLHPPVPSIAELNRMERVYEESPPVVDNRQWNIVLVGEGDKEALRRVLAGEPRLGGQDVLQIERSQESNEAPLQAMQREALA